MGFLLEMIFHALLLLMPLLAMFPSFYFIAVGNSVFILLLGIMTFIIVIVYLIE